MPHPNEITCSGPSERTTQLSPGSRRVKPQQPNEKSKKEAGRATLGVISRLVAIIAATFAFAAFSGKPTQPQPAADSHATRADDRINRH